MFGDRAPFSKGLNECPPLSQGLHLALKMASRKQQKKAKFGGEGGGRVGRESRFFSENVPLFMTVFQHFCC